LRLNFWRRKTMLNCFVTTPTEDAVSIKPLTKSMLTVWQSAQDARLRHWLLANRFVADPGTICLVPDQQGRLAQVLVGIAHANDFWVFGDLPARLPAGQYQIDLLEPLWPQAQQWRQASVAWGLGSYSFTRYLHRNRKPETAKPQLILPVTADPALCIALTESIYWVRDLINTPTEDMSPSVLAAAAVALTESFGVTPQVVTGVDLAAGYPMITAVGRGSTRAPCLVDFQWGEKTAPLLTLVGKGICFDSGGMNLKSSEGMRYMKKDMGGAAHVLGLARLIMSQRLPVRLRVLLPIAENMVAGNSYRPGDVVITRAGISVEVTNTDAEGRLVLCDALTAAIEQSPDLLLDFSTLTGAARIALGPDVAAFFANQDTLAADLSKAAEATNDPVWRLPLYQPYERYLKSEVADITNASTGPYAGAITAALYLKQFVPDAIPWMHFDISAWNFDKLPGRPVGGEVNGLRAVYAFLQERYLKK
jgi:leucyl aminopeptidase